jgi:hypothetical protein
MYGSAIECSDSVREFCGIKIVETDDIRQRNVIASILFDDGPIVGGCPVSRETEKQDDSQKANANGSAFAAKSRTDAEPKATADKREWTRMSRRREEPRMNTDRRG